MSAAGVIEEVAFAHFFFLWDGNWGIVLVVEILGGGGGDGESAFCGWSETSLVMGMCVMLVNAEWILGLVVKYCLCESQVCRERSTW